MRSQSFDKLLMRGGMLRGDAVLRRTRGSLLALLIQIIAILTRYVEQPLGLK